MPPDWVRDAVFYQIFPDRFAASARVPKPGPMEPWDSPPTVHGFKGGDLLGIVERLDYLAELGITALYLNPVFASASNHRYHTYDYMAVDPLLGGDAALRELLDACHARGMRVVLDGVFNHASRGFWPFHHVLEAGRHSPYRDWFHLNAEMLDADRQIRAYPEAMLRGELGAEWGEEHAAGTQSLDTLGYRAWWDLPALPKLNTDNPHVRDYLFGVAEHWIRFGIDGWRLDVPHEITDDEFWREFRRRVRAINPEAYIVAEIWHEAPATLRGDQYDALMGYPLAEAIISHVTGSHLDSRVVGQHGELAANIRPDDAPTFRARVERAMSVYEPATTASQLNLIGSHDTPRFRTMAGGDLPSLRLALLVLLTLPGAPCIYYGDELGMEGEMDPGCRGAFPADPANPANPANFADNEMLSYTRALIALRHAHPLLRHGGVQFLAADGMASVYARTDADATMIVAINPGDEPARISLPEGFVAVPLPGQQPWTDGQLAPRSGYVLTATP